MKLRDLKKTVTGLAKKVGVDNANVLLCQKCECANCRINKRMTSGEKRAHLAELIGHASGRYAAGNGDVMRGQLREMVALAKEEFERQVRDLGYNIEVRDEAAVLALVARAEPIRKWRAEVQKEDRKWPPKPQSEWPVEPEIDWEAP
jgi:hypothetical protein